MIHSCLIPSPIGELYLEANDQELIRVSLPAQKRPSTIHGDAQSEILIKTRNQLTEYFDGQRTHFDLPLQKSGTDFESAVWQALRSIPFAATCSYGAIAETIGNSKASRAVGAANRKNPFAIIVPCHRVIGASGKLVGYAGGMATKQWLLTHEQNIAHKICN